MMTENWGTAFRRRELSVRADGKRDPRSSQRA